MSDSPEQFRAQLAELRDDQEPASDDAQPPPIDSDTAAEALGQADWHLKRVRKLRNQLADLEEVYWAEINRLQDRLEERGRIIVKEIDWHLQPVQQLHQRLVDLGTHPKTIELPHGTMKLTVPTKPTVVVDDQPGLVEWALANAPELLPAPRKVNVSDVKTWGEIRDGKVIDPQTGEVVPHVHAETPPPRWHADTEPGSPL